MNRRAPRGRASKTKFCFCKQKNDFDVKGRERAPEHCAKGTQQQRQKAQQYVTFPRTRRTILGLRVSMYFAVLIAFAFIAVFIAFAFINYGTVWCKLQVYLTHQIRQSPLSRTSRCFVMQLPYICD